MKKNDKKTRFPIQAASRSQSAESERELTEDARAVREKFVEEELRESEERLKLTAEAGRIGNWQIDLTTDTLESSAICRANFGLAANEDLSFERLFEILHPDDRDRVRAALEKAVETGTDYDAEYRVVWSDDSVHWIVARGRAFYAADGTPLRMLGVTQNITGRKETEQRLRKSEERFRSYFELGLIGMAITSPTKGWLAVNDEFCKILGYERDEMLEKNWAEMTHPEDLAADVANFDRVTAGEIDGYRLDKRFIRKDNRIIDATISVKCVRRDDGSVDYFVGLLEDVTERKRAEEALRESEAKYRTLFDSIDEGFCLIEVLFDRQGKAFDYRFLEMNPVFERQSGLENACGKTILELVPDLEPQWAETYGQVARTGEAVRFEADVHAMNHVFDIYAFPANAPATVAVLFTDITERKQTETALRESEENYRVIVNQAVAGIFKLDLEGKVAFCNQRFGEMLDYDCEELLETSADKIIYVEDLPRNNRLFERLKNQGLSFEFEMRLVRKDGSLIWVNNQVSPVFNPAGNPKSVIVVSVDITERVQAEEALRQANDELEHRVSKRTRQLSDLNADLKKEIEERERVEADRERLLSRIVSAQEDEQRRIAREMHDQFGQNLSALALKLSALKNDYEKQPELRENFAALEAIVKRLDADVDFLVRDLRPTALDDFGLVVAVSNYIKNWSKHFGIRAEMHTIGMGKDRLTHEIETVLYRVTQEALTNVAKHANAENVDVILERRSDSVSVLIEDDGIGFDAERAFGANEKGFGLIGMRERAALAGGVLRIESSSGRGATVVVRIPAAHVSNGGDEDE